MIEFFQENVFFIVVALLMFWCHFSHHSHGGHGEKTPPDGSNQK
jgi:hypothetical protein